MLHCGSVVDGFDGSVVDFEISNSTLKRFCVLGSGDCLKTSVLYANRKAKYFDVNWEREIWRMADGCIIGCIEIFHHHTDRVVVKIGKM